ncbi:MAG: hypothetical protein PHE29_14395 [Tissierellia bacterium]|nr:hypothetical protein [Tissierellia bacterium]
MIYSTQTILISLCTSLLVSLFTFILGLKSGKNQVDRAMVQKVYKEIFKQLDELERFIQNNRPRRWSQYEKVQLDLSSYRYVPPIAKLEMSGELLHIKASIANKAVKLEEELIKYGSDIFYSINQIQAVLTSDRTLYVDGCQFKQYQGQRKDAHFETINPTDCRRSIEFDYRDFYDKDRIFKCFSCLKSDEPCNIEFRLQTKNDCITYKVSPNSLTVEPEIFVEKMYEKFNSEIKEFSRLYASKIELLKKIEILNKKISKRVRDPFSFWETLCGAFLDIFR